MAWICKTDRRKHRIIKRVMIMVSSGQNTMMGVETFLDEW